MAGVAGPMLHSKRDAGARLLTGLLVGEIVGGLLLALPAFLLGEGLHAALGLQARLWLVAAVCLFLDSPIHRAGQIRARLRGEDLQAPHLIDLEVAQALRKLVLTQEVAAARAEVALTDLAEFPLARHPHYPFLSDI